MSQNRNGDECGIRAGCRFRRSDGGSYPAVRTGVSLWRWFGGRCGGDVGAAVAAALGRVRSPGASGRCRVERFRVAVRRGCGFAAVVDWFVEVAVDEALGAWAVLAGGYWLWMGMYALHRRRQFSRYVLRTSLRPSAERNPIITQVRAMNGAPGASGSYLLKYW
jgi:hypothetical protein